jgi:hypothetical protein
VAVPAAYDPIFAAIDEHRAAFTQKIAIACNTPSDDDDFINSGPVYDAAYDRTEKAAIELTNVRPATIAGVVTLLEYVDHFNRGCIRHTRRNYYSEHVFWPEDLVDNDDTREMPFAYWLLENVREALAEIGRQSPMAR